MDWLVPLVMGKARGVSRGVTVTNAASPISSPEVLSSCMTTSMHTLPSPTTSASPFLIPPNSIIEFDNHTITPPMKPFGNEVTYLRAGSPSAASVVGSLYLQTGKTSPGSGKECSPSPELGTSQKPTFMQCNFISQQICQTDFAELVEPFPSMDHNEWLAAHTIALFENLTTIFDAIQDLCTCISLFPNNHRGQCLTLWLNQLDLTSPIGEEDRSKKNKPSTASLLSIHNAQCARQMIDYALSFCHEMIQSSHLFPVRSGDSFPADLPANVTLVCKHLLLCIIHLYLSHSHHLEQFELISHMNTLAKHYFAFTTRFSLVEEKHFEPLSGFHQALFSTNTSSADVNLVS